MFSTINRNLIKPCSDYQTRKFFFKYLKVVFNNVDMDRIKKIGPDRACSEWLIRNGAQIKWLDEKFLVTNVFELSKEHYVGERLLHHVVADNASISYEGFMHFAGCKYLELISMKNCEYIDDMAMEELRHALNCPLKYLEIAGCPGITDEGLKKIPPFTGLKTLVLDQLLGVDRMLLCAEHLQKTFPNTELFINGNKWTK